MAGDAEVQLDDETVVAFNGTDAMSAEEVAGTGVGAPADEDRRHRLRWVDGRLDGRLRAEQDRACDRGVAEHVGHRAIVPYITTIAYSPV